MRKHSYYLQLDEDFLEDPEVQLFIAEKGKAAVLDYISLLLIMRAYRNTDYMIPYAMIPILAKTRLGTTKEDLEDTIAYCVKIGFFRVYEDEIDKVKYFYSARRQLDLRTWQVKSDKNRESGIKGMKNRWHKEGDTDKDDKKED